MATTTNKTGKANQLRTTGFLTDHKGKLSSMRLMSWASLLAAIVFGWITLTLKDNQSQSAGIYITFGFLTASFGGKAFQKFTELNSSSLHSASENQ